jgi:hypothetical protein
MASLSIRDVHALPPEQASVNRPDAGPEQGQRHAEGREQDVNPRIGVLREESPDPEQGRERRRNGRPKSHEQKESETDLEDEQRGWSDRERSRQSRYRTKNQYRAGNEPHDQQPCAWQAGGECREEPSQGNPQ